jgi:ubiquitin-conjugating enzyme E2 variant
MLPELKKAGGTEPRSPAPAPGSRTHHVWEVGSLTVTLVLLGWMVVRVGRGISSEGQALGVAGLAVAAYLLADLLSGIVHWAGDTLGDEKAGWFGPAFSLPFREHHKDPREIASHGFVETNGNTGIVALTPLAAGHVFMAPRGLGFYAGVFIAGLTLFGLATNQCHKWAHRLHPPRMVRLLQRCGLVINPDHHDRHHKWPHRTHYCVLSGWMNFVADRLKLFRAAEHVIRRYRPTWLSAEAARPTLVPPTPEG